MKKIIATVGFLGVFLSQAILSSAAYFNSAPLPVCEAQITQTLQRGSEGLQVHLVQTVLVNSGFLQAVPNAYFGYQTESAVRAFQANNGISPTGIVGPSTRNAINERMCDSNLLDSGSYYGDINSYPYSIGQTYVSDVDPFVNVKVITPPVSIPTVYNTPQVSSYVTPSVTVSNQYSTSVAFPTVSPSQVQSTNIIYSPSIGYTYGIVPQSGSITVSSPVTNAIYNEGDTVQVAWGMNNLPSTPVSILLESSISGQSRIVGTTVESPYSFVLSKELLDSVCSGTCNNTNQQGSFKVVVSTPTTDIAGITSNLRAAVSPITVRRPLAAALISISASKTPVNSGEILRLYVNIPSANQFNGYQLGSYSFRIRAVCPSGVQVSIAGAPCGQDFAMPATSSNNQQEVPVGITNTSWYKQDVTFILTAINASGQVIGGGETQVTVNAAPFNW